MDEILSIRRKAKWSDVLPFSLLPYDKVAVFTHAICMNSDANLVDGEASLYFLKLVLFRPYLASAWVKKRKT